MDLSEAHAELRSILESVEVEDDANSCRDTCRKALEKSGWACKMEVYVPNRGDGRRGRVDIQASKDGMDAGIEIDRKDIRRKSVIKLYQREWIRVVASRLGTTRPTPGFVDLCISLRLKGASDGSHRVTG